MVDLDLLLRVVGIHVSTARLLFPLLHFLLHDFIDLMDAHPVVYFLDPHAVPLAVALGLPELSDEPLTLTQLSLRLLPLLLLLLSSQKLHLHPLLFVSDQFELSEAFVFENLAEVLLVGLDRLLNLVRVVLRHQVTPVQVVLELGDALHSIDLEPIATLPLSCLSSQLTVVRPLSSRFFRARNLAAKLV